MEISQKIIHQAGEQLLGHLQIQKDRISDAYSNNSEILGIGMKCRFSYVKNKFKIQTEINFVESRCKDQAVTWYDPKQKQFFDNEPADDGE
jgi:hypothetical protein